MRHQSLDYCRLGRFPLPATTPARKRPALYSPPFIAPNLGRPHSPWPLLKLAPSWLWLFDSRPPPPQRRRNRGRHHDHAVLDRHLDRHPQYLPRCHHGAITMMALLASSTDTVAIGSTVTGGSSPEAYGRLWSGGSSTSAYTNCIDVVVIHLQRLEHL